MPKIETQFEELPKFDELQIGQKLTITNVLEGKTPKNNYPCVTLTTKEMGKIFATEKGVLYALSLVKGEISASDPLTVKVVSYTDSKNETRKSIKNA